MYDFTKNKATKRSISLRKPINGMGLNDADYVISPTANGKRIICPIYLKWTNMLMRCYSSEYQALYPTYTYCTVVGEWLLFSNFRAWMIEQDYDGMALDKDIKFKGNKIYSPSTCLFIPEALNNLLSDCAARRGEYPVGVYLHNPLGKFQSRINVDGKRKSLGYFTSPQQASEAYQQARRIKIQQIIDDNIYPVATMYLSQHI